MKHPQRFSARLVTLRTALGADPVEDMWKFEIGFLQNNQDCVLLSVVPCALLLDEVIGSGWYDDRLVAHLERIVAALFPPYARNSLTTCCVMRTPKNIQTLIDISKSRLSSFVTKLIVSSEVLCPVKESWCFGPLDP